MYDAVEILTRPRRVGGAKLVIDQKIIAREKRLLSVRVTIALINSAGRPRRLPGTVAERFGVAR